DDPDAVLAELARELRAAGEAEVTVAVLRDRIERWNGDPFRPAVVADDVSPDLWVTLSERTATLPGVGVDLTLERVYPYGSTAAHVLGYVGEINGSELEQAVGKPKPYEPGDSIGKSGVERIYEDLLRGTPGQVTLEVDSLGRVVRVLDEIAPRPGADLRLTIDVDVQAHTERALAAEAERVRTRGDVSSNGIRATAPSGAAVVLDPTDGAVVAMASFPTFDPNQVTSGISTEAWAWLQDPANQLPLLNRSIQGTYAPGSTFKLVVAHASAATGARPPDQWIDDPGIYEIVGCTAGRCEFENANRTPYGSVDMARSLAVSSDVYYFSLADQLWRARNVYGDAPMQDSARSFGFDTQTGVQLPFEAAGLIIDPERQQARYEANPDLFLTGNWNTGDNLNVSIGSGDVLVTPLQLANAYATFANGGTRYSPTIAVDATDPLTGEVLQVFGARPAGQVELSPTFRDAALRGLLGAVRDPGGTATAVFSGFPLDTFPVAGKTGTSERDGRADTSLFAAFAPADDPRYALAVVMDQSGFGSRAAAPAARRILEPLSGAVPLPRAPLVGEPPPPEVVPDVPDGDLGAAD
ncbi:MAG TPA: penicillin-binding transpeptidase domain-containing protein, partial [Acidimicrobiales bacterium]|nr:penicillin-binding transpeptidase domain-containing protein [Acidimicrobiales bacterium]